MGYGKGKPRVKGDYGDYCAYCGGKFMRSELVRDRSGQLKCSDEGDGLDTVALGELEQQHAKAAMERIAHKRRRDDL